MDYIRDKEQGVDVISNFIKSGQPFCVTLIGLGEFLVCKRKK